MDIVVKDIRKPLIQEGIRHPFFCIGLAHPLQLPWASESIYCEGITNVKQGHRGYLRGLCLYIACA